MAQPALDYGALPDDPVARREVLELRTVPDPDRPRVSAAREARLAGLEEKTAQCYVELEDVTSRMRKLAAKIGNTVPTSRMASEAG